MARTCSTPAALGKTLWIDMRPGQTSSMRTRAVNVGMSVLSSTEVESVLCSIGRCSKRRSSGGARLYLDGGVKAVVALKPEQVVSERQISATRLRRTALWLKCMSIPRFPLSAE
jgi:hypothetical protein